MSYLNDLRVMNAVRLYNTNNSWFVFGQPTTWGSPYSDSAPPNVNEVGTLQSPFLAVKANLYLVYEVTPSTGTFSYNDTTMQTCTVQFGGTVTVGDTLNLILTSNVSGGLTGSPLTLSYVTQSGDTASSIAIAFANLINANSACQVSLIYASPSSGQLVVQSPAPIQISITESTSSGATETIVVGPINNPVRYFDAFSSVAASIAASNTLCLATCSFYGSAVTGGQTQYRQIGINSLLVPASGYSSNLILNGAQVENWGTCEALSNWGAESLTPSSLLVEQNQMFGF